MPKYDYDEIHNKLYILCNPQEYDDELYFWKCSKENNVDVVTPLGTFYHCKLECYDHDINADVYIIKVNYKRMENFNV